MNKPFEMAALSQHSQTILSYFEKISAIPRASKQEHALREMIITWAEENEVQTRQDAIGNLYLYRKGTDQKQAPILMQAHLDMVTQKTPDSSHNFDQDGIELIVAGEFLKANNTTLGADNGIGVAAILSVMERGYPSDRPMEALLTVDEEAGMGGALALEPNRFKAKTLLNLDSEQDGDVYIGCAGGVDVDIKATLPFTSAVNQYAYRIRISGLRGGHSGLDINKGRANACLQLLNLLRRLAATDPSLGVCEITAGNARNAIPRDATVTLSSNLSLDLINKQIELFRSDFQSEFADVEKKLTVSVEMLDDLKAPVLYGVDLELTLAALMDLPNGVVAYAAHYPGIVETSLNFSLFSVSDGRLNLSYLLRSFDDCSRDDLARALGNSGRASGLGDVEVDVSGAYPAWPPNIESAASRLLCSNFREIYGEDPNIQLIHAGLECGLIAAKYPELDMVSFGPTIKFPHSPEECLHLPSLDRFANLLRLMIRDAT